jgi:O-antigen/teichoic acid export membrane protein
MVPSLKSQTLSLFSGKVVAYLVTAVTPVILVRLLSPEQFGAYRQVLFLYAVALPVIKFMIPESLYFFYPRKKKIIHRYLSQTLTLLCINGVIGSCLIVLFGGYFKWLPSGLTADFVMPLALFLLIEAVGSMIEHIFVLEKNIFLTFTGNLANSILRVMLIVGAVYLFADVIAIVYALILWSVLRLGATVWYLIGKYPSRPGFSSRAMLKEQLSYSLPIAVGGVIGLIGAQIDKGIISGYMTPEDFALYSLGSLGIMSAVKVLYVSLGNVFVPRFGELAVNKDLDAIRRLWHKMILMNAIVTIPIVTFFIIYAPQVISILYTDRYLQATNLWRLNMMVLIIQMTGFGYIPKAMGRTGSIFAGNVARFIVSVPLSIYLIIEIGLVGGVIAFVVGFWVNALIQLRACKTSIEASFASFLPWELLLRILLISLLSASILPFFSRLSANHYIQVGCGAIWFFPAVGLLLLAFKIIEIDDIRLLFKKRFTGARSTG